jgi:hypothetical protein
MMARGRKPIDRQMWVYLLDMHERLEGGRAKSVRNAAQQTVDEFWRHMPNLQSKESTRTWLQRHYAEHRATLLRPTPRFQVNFGIDPEDHARVQRGLARLHQQLLEGLKPARLGLLSMKVAFTKMPTSKKPDDPK